jgi:MFS transporter, DHA2 family, multidrug resistance protein
MSIAVDEDGLPIPRRYWAMAAMWLGLAMAVLDGAIANVALPTIARDLHTQASESIWVVNAFQIAVVVSLLPAAALGEIVSYRKVYRFGVVVFTAASLGCALSHSLTALVVARAVQGIGGAAIMGVNGAVLRHTYPRPMLGRAIGYNAFLVAVFTAIGPTVAAAILAVGPWPVLFAVNVPIGLASLIIGWRSLPEKTSSGGRLDLASTLYNVLAFGGVIAGADLLTRGGPPVLGAVALAIGLGAVVLLVRRSLGRQRPLVPLDLLANPIFSLSVLTSIGAFAVQSLALVALPFYFQGALHRSQVETGLLLTPWPVAVALGAPIAGWLVERVPAAILGGAGLAALAVGALSLALLPAAATDLDIVWRMALCGIGFGLFQTPNNRTMLSSAPLARTGAAGGMLATARLTGQTTGATLVAIVFHLTTRGEPLALELGAGFAVMAMIASLSRLGRSSD